MCMEYWDAHRIQFIARFVIIYPMFMLAIIVCLTPYVTL